MSDFFHPIRGADIPVRNSVPWLGENRPGEFDLWHQQLKLRTLLLYEMYEGWLFSEHVL